MGSFHLTKNIKPLPPLQLPGGFGGCKAHCMEHRTSSQPSGKALSCYSKRFRKRVIKQCGSIKEADLGGEQCYSLQKGSFPQINLLPAALLVLQTTTAVALQPNNQRRNEINLLNGNFFVLLESCCGVEEEAVLLSQGTQSLGNPKEVPKIPSLKSI